MIKRESSPRISLLLVAVTLLCASSSLAQSSTGTDASCDSIYDCNACLSNANNCVFAVGSCFDVCKEPDNGATCYSSKTFTVSTTSEICEMYDDDNLKCTKNKSCQDCIQTLKADGNSCQWYEQAGACFGGGTGPFGSGALTCPGMETDTVTPTAAPTADDLQDQATCQVQTDCGSCTSTSLSAGGSCFWFEDAGTCSNESCLEDGVTCGGVNQCPSDAADDDTDDSCGSSSDCQTCLQANCVWSPSLESCASSCTDLPQDAECYDPSTFAGQNALATCQAVTDTCQAASNDCQACLENNCAWSPTAEQSCAPSCREHPQDSSCYTSSTFADLNAHDTCQAATNMVQDRELCNGKTRCDTCTNTIKTDGSNCQWYSDQNTGVQWCQVGGCDMNGVCGSETCDATAEEGNSDNENITVPTDTDTTATDGEASSGCDSFDGYGSDGCLPCLGSDQNCAWVLQTCVPSCSSMADAPCFSTSTFPDSTPDEICKEASVSQEDIALCGSKNYCFTCTSTIKSDGVSTCSWYTNGDQEWCDVGGCNAEGICGDSDESVCQPPEVEEPDTGSSSNNDNNNNNNNGGSVPVMPSINDGEQSSARRGWGWMVGTMIMAMMLLW